ncbi:MAG: T9SS type A sorting domain-containing protein, partial [Calditrichaeota bacterium]|nr:T9SS type A sorting domain-containing protein [Calditrichota bacterium]
AYYGWAVGGNGVIRFWDGSIWTAQSSGFGSDLYSVYAVGGTAYACGANGVVLKYVSGGWVDISPGVSVDFYEVVFYDELRGYLVGANGHICRTDDGGQTWIPLNSGVDTDCHSIALYGPNIAWVTCADGLVLQTTDGGLTWTRCPLGVPGSLHGISFANCQGIAVGDDGRAFSFTSSHCNLNSGIYTRLNTGTSVHLYGISFSDALNGCIAGDGGTVLVTHDGGNSWTASYTGVSNCLTDIQLLDGSAFICGQDGLLCRSDDNGASWIPFTTNTNITFHALSFRSINLGWAVGANGTICRYNGSTWIPETVGTNITFYGVYAVGNTAYAVGENGTICRYINGVWTPQATGTSATFYDVAFVNENFGYAVGEGGLICLTRDGGITWVPVNCHCGVAVDLKACKVVSPKVAYCVGEDGTVIKTEDCGETWEVVNVGVETLLEDLEIVDGQGFAIGDLGDAFGFNNPGLAEFPLFSLSADSLSFGETDIATGGTQVVWVRNTGTVDLVLDDILPDTSLFVAQSDTNIVMPGDSAAITIRFAPAGTGFAIGHISFHHSASCEVASLPCSGTGAEIAQPCDITGTVYSDGEPLAGVTVTLLDTAGIAIENYPSVITDEQGNYFFAMVPPDSYQVSIVEPLGFVAESNPRIVNVGDGNCQPLDFVITELVICNNARSAGYWKHQFTVRCGHRGHAQENEADLIAYIAKVHEKYSVHFNIFDGEDSFQDWRDLLRTGCRSGHYHNARRQVAALVLNLVSLKIGQYTEVTADGRTAGDVLTYVSQLLTDGDHRNDELAKDLAERVNLQRRIRAGLVPDGNILYRGGNGPVNWNFENLPERFELAQNYPNPFNPGTTIAYDLPKAQQVNLTVYNILGQVVSVLVNDYQEGGRYQVKFDGGHLASGLYIVRFSTPEFTKIRKMILMK